MRWFPVAVVAVLAGIGATLWAGSLPERRYENDACQHRMIYNYAPETEMGLVTLGGSRVRVSTNATDFNRVLEELRPDAAPMHNLAHSYFSIGKEYVLLRDLLEHHSPKAVVIMIEPRKADFGDAHPGFADIARLSDIPLAVSALWPESPLAAIRAGRDIVFEHLFPFDRAGRQHREMTDHNCDRLDYRLSVDILDRAATRFETVSRTTLDWDLTQPAEDGFLRWMTAYRALSEASGTQVMFLLVTATTEPLPAADMESRFEEATGLALITLDPALHARLSADGKRDASHMNAAGREEFLPWLITRIEEKCSQPEGCL